MKRWAVGLGLIMVVAACGADGSPGASGGSAGPAPVVIRTDPASASDCAHGGSVVLAGTDDNGNMVLDDGEIDTRTAVCNPPPTIPAPPTVLRLVDEPAGANCVAGGTAVQTGPDSNGNGQLDDDEVAHTDYACGDRLLTRLETELPGERCIAGGVAVEAGPDRDHDGVLDDDEVAHTDYICGDVVRQDVTVRSAADAAALANITAIEGTLTIDRAVTPTDGELSLPQLRHVRDFLWVLDTTQLRRLRLLKLEEVGGYVSIARNAGLEVLEVPALRTVSRSIFVGDNPKLQDLESLRQLDLVGADLTVANNASLTSLPLQGITIGGTLDIEQNPALAAIDGYFDDRLDQAIIDNNGLTTLTLSSFALQRSSTTLGRVQITRNPALTELSVDADQPGDVVIANNPSLVHALLFAQEVHGDIVVFDDPSLAELTLFKFGLDHGPLEVRGALTVIAPIRTLNSGFSSLSIDGGLTLEGSHLTSLRLERVGGTLRLAHNPELTGDLFVERGFGGSLEVVDNASLGYLDPTRQTTINGHVIVTGNPKLLSTQVLLEATTVTGDVTIANNDSLRGTLSDGLVRVTGSIQIQSNPALTDVSLSNLQLVQDLTVVDNVALPTLALSALRYARDIRLDSNYLSELTMPALVGAESLRVTNNRRLPTCQIEAIFARIPSARHEQSNNDDAATCP